MRYTDLVLVYRYESRPSGICKLCGICEGRILGTSVRQRDQFYHGIVMHVSFQGKYNLKGYLDGHIRMYVYYDHFISIQDDDVCRRILSYIPESFGTVVSDRACSDHGRSGREHL